MIKALFTKIKQHKRNIIIAAIPLLIIICGVAVLLINSRPEPDTVEDYDFGLSVYRLSEHTQDDVLYLKGVVTSRYISEINTSLNVPLKSLYIKVGDTVSKGDVLCKFDTSEIDSQIQDLEKEKQDLKSQEEKEHNRNIKALKDAKSNQESSLSKIEAEINALESEIWELNAQLAAAESTEDTDNVTYNTDAITTAEAIDDEELEDTLPDIVLTEPDEPDEPDTSDLKSRISEAEDELKTARETYDSVYEETNAEIEECSQAIEDEVVESTSYDSEILALQNQLSLCTITAPQDGIVTNIGLSIGEVPSGEPIITIADMNNPIISTSVTENHLLDIHKSTVALITPYADENSSYFGSVSEISTVPLIDAESDEDESGNLYSVTVDVGTLGFPWGYNMNVSVMIPFNNKIYIFSVPYEYIQSDSKGDYVFIAEETDNDEFTARKNYVSLGTEHMGGELIEIYFEGINNNTVLLCDNGFGLRNGDIIPLEYLSEYEEGNDDNEYANLTDDDFIEDKEIDNDEK